MMNIGLGGSCDSLSGLPRTPVGTQNFCQQKDRSNVELGRVVADAPEDAFAGIADAPEDALAGVADAPEDALARVADAPKDALACRLV